MLAFQGLIGSVSERMMLVTTLIIIFFLIAFELIRVEKDEETEKELGKIMNPAILVLIVIFIFIVITKVMAILK